MRAVLALAALVAPMAALPATLWTLGPNAAGEHLTFTDQKGPCVGSAHVVIWTQPDKPPVPGCYRIEGGVVFIAFLDGDQVKPIPESALQKVKDS